LVGIYSLFIKVQQSWQINGEPKVNSQPTDHLISLNSMTAKGSKMPKLSGRNIWWRYFPSL